jgi:hypothetical protein
VHSLTEHTAAATAIPVIQYSTTARAGLPTAPPTPRLTYQLDMQSVFWKGDSAMAPFMCRSQQAVEWGAPRELAIPGTLQCTFSPAARLTALRLTYDVRSVSMQLQPGGAGSGATDTESVVSNSVSALNAAAAAAVTAAAAGPLPTLHDAVVQARNNTALQQYAAPAAAAPVRSSYSGAAPRMMPAANSSVHNGQAGSGSHYQDLAQGTAV